MVSAQNAVLRSIVGYEEAIVHALEQDSAQNLDNNEILNSTLEEKDSFSEEPKP